VGVVLNLRREVGVVVSDLGRDLIESLSQAPIVVVDTGKLFANESPRDASGYARGVTSIEKKWGHVPKEGAWVESPHEGKGKADSVLAKVSVELRVENDAVAADIRGHQVELRAMLGYQEFAGLDAVARGEGIVEGRHVAVTLAGRGPENKSEGETHEAFETLLEAAVFGTWSSKLEGVKEGGQVVEADPAGLVGKGCDPRKKSAVGAEGQWDAEFRSREVDGEVGFGA
jgi:hypothetical protein